MQNLKWPPWNNWSEHIVVNNLDRDKIISPNRLFLQSRNAIKQTIHLGLFDIIIMQNSRWTPWNDHFDNGGIF